MTTLNKGNLSRGKHRGLTELEQEICGSSKGKAKALSQRQMDDNDLEWLPDISISSTF